MLIKTLAKSVRQYKKQSVLSSIFMVLEVFVEVLIPYFMAALIDNGIDAGNMSYITRMGIMLLVFAATSLTLGALSGSYAASASTGYGANLRNDIFKSIQGFSFANIDKFSPASLVTRLTTDVNNVAMAYQAIIRHAVRSICMITFAMTMTFRVNPQAALIFVGVAPVLGVGLILIVLKVHPFFVRALKTYDRLNNVVQENLQGIRVVKSYVREEQEKSKFQEISEQIAHFFKKGQRGVALNMPFIQLCTYACMILISWVGARLIVSGEMSTGDMMSLFAYAMQILMNLMLMSMVFVQIIIARSSAERIFETLTEQPDIQNSKNPVTAVPDGSISFENVDFSYVKDLDKLCLMNINLDIKSGETIGIIGGTGSSKSTLVQLIPRLYDVTGGCIKVGGIDVKEYDIQTLRDQVAAVLQKNVLFSGTIKENLRWGNPEATDEQMEAACALAQAHGFIKSFPDGYDTYIEEGGTNVSGGQRQRLCIARALLKNPKVLILDDSTSAVDTRTDALIRQAFREQIPNVTKLIIAQRIASVEDADRIIVMENGRVNAVGTHAQLLETNAIYQQVHQTQRQGGDFDEKN